MPRFTQDALNNVTFLRVRDAAPGCILVLNSSLIGQRGTSARLGSFFSGGFMFRVKTALFAFLLLVSAAMLGAQTITGSITGIVMDPSSASVANVKVTATNVGTN